MSRNLRNRNHPAPNPVSSYTVAPDHYNSPDEIDRSVKQYMAETYRDWKALNPYQPGDIVWIEVYERDGSKSARKAFISDIFPERDRYGDRRAKYRVHIANKTGDSFARNWVYTWPGFIERGYKRAAAI